jgi:hypothetical protein
LRSRWQRASLLALAFGACVGSQLAWGRLYAYADPGAAPARRTGPFPAPASADGTSTVAPNGARAPNEPPLGAAGAGSAAGGDGEGGEGSSQLEADPLVSNGLGSPLCKGALGDEELPAPARRHCETSGFVAAAAPTGDYGIDVHIDTGVLGLNASTAVQDLVVAPLWMAVVWSVHAVVVMLEWCFTIDVLDSAAGEVARGLRRAQTTLTEPWLVVVLAVASVLALYNGLVRRRVAETLGQALLMAAMMVGGLWVIADPTGTVDALAGWANQASLGTLAAAARGTPSAAGGALAQSMGTVFAAAIEAPWCYLEFGDVSWCRSPARLEPRLRAAGLKIAAGELALVACSASVGSLSPCAAAGSAQAKALERTAALLREAQSNGAIFLALPANGPARNSINDEGSLLRTLCQSSEATSCRGPTAAQAEFRTSSGTLPRLGGLLLIAAGALGMVLLLGFIAVRLLTAAIFSLLYLLMAPGMVLAPALGDGGRTVFRRWAGQLLGAVVAKLLFSFLLGVVLAVLAILADLQALGWWTQWLLMSAFWWGVYVRRHQALGLAEGGFVERRRVGVRGGGPAMGWRRPGSAARGMTHALDTPRRAIGAARSTMKRLGGSMPSVEQSLRAQPGRGRAQAGPGTQPSSNAQALRMLEREHADARELTQSARPRQQSLRRARAQLERVRSAQAAALAREDRRQAVRLAHRGARIEAEIQREQARLDGALRVVGERQRASRRSGPAYTREQVQERELFLDAQAALLPARASAKTKAGERQGGGRRDYAALACLLGYGRAQYEQLAPRERRAARVEIDRQLASRRQSSIHGTRASPGARPASDRARAVPRNERRWTEHSSVMADAREVAARRKRQLGSEEP